MMIEDLAALRASRRQFLIGAAALSCAAPASATPLSGQGRRAGRSDGAAFYTNPRGYAVRGYDPVSYVEDGDAVRGLAAHQFGWRGARWRFSNAAHRDAFAAAPERYAPQYGGYCASAVREGYLTPGDAGAWDIFEGKLYLMCSTDALARWRRDPIASRAAADRNWPILRRA